MIKYCILFGIVISGCKDTVNISESKIDNALTAMNLAIEKNPGNDSLYFYRSDYFLKIDSTDAAIRDLLKAISIDSTSKPGYYHKLTDAYLAQSKSKKALQTLENCLNYFPDHIPSIIKFAQLNLILKQHMAALATLDKVFLRDPQNSEAFYLAGHIFYEMGDTARAINSYQKSVDLNPELRTAWIQIGDLLTEMKNKRAIAYYDNAILLDSLEPEIFHKKAFALYSFGKTSEAVMIYKNICIQYPSYEPAYYNLGYIYLKLDSIDQAIEHFTIATRLDPAEASTLFQRGKCYLKSGKTDLAITDFENTIRLDDQNEEARALLKKLQK